MSVILYFLVFVKKSVVVFMCTTTFDVLYDDGLTHDIVDECTSLCWFDL